MTGFVGRWLAHALRLVLALGLALAAMQLPALAHQYAAALLQVSESGRRDIEQRKAAARQFYPGAGESDAEVIAALQPVEPSNAQALRTSVARAAAIEQAFARIDAAPPLVRPVVAALDAADDPTGEKRTVLATAFDTFVPQVMLTGDALLYGLVGLLLGSFLGEAIAAAAGAAVRGPRRTGAAA